MDKEKISKEDKAIQKVVNQMLADKMIQHFFYIGCIKAIAADERRVIDCLFKKIAEKKLNEHFKSFMTYAELNYFDVPVKLSEFEKHADNKVLRCLESLKRDEKATYYVEKAVEIEDAMVEAANDIVEKDKDGLIPYELMSIVFRDRCDDIECKDMLNSLADAYKAGADYMVF